MNKVKSDEIYSYMGTLQGRIRSIGELNFKESSESQTNKLYFFNEVKLDHIKRAHMRSTEKIYIYLYSLSCRNKRDG